MFEEKITAKGQPQKIGVRHRILGHEGFFVVFFEAHILVSRGIEHQKKRGSGIEPEGMKPFRDVVSRLKF